GRLDLLDHLDRGELAAPEGELGLDGRARQLVPVRVLTALRADLLRDLRALAPLRSAFDVEADSTRPQHVRVVEPRDAGVGRHRLGRPDDGDVVPQDGEVALFEIDLLRRGPVARRDDRLDRVLDVRTGVDQVLHEGGPAHLVDAEVRIRPALRAR